MITPENTLCPMAFNNPTYDRTHYVCLGKLCGWFDEEIGRCAVFSKGKVVETVKPYLAPVKEEIVEAVEEPAPKPKRTRKKTAEE